MTRKDSVYESYYEPFLHGDGNKTNSVNSRQVAVEQMYSRILTELSINRFKWDGLPDSVDERFMEKILFFNGLSVFYFNTDYDKFMALRGSGAGPINMYDNYTSFRVYGNTFVNETIDADSCVPIWTNSMRVPDTDITRIYSNKLADIDRTIEIATENMRFTNVITAPEKQRLSWTNILRQKMEGQPVIFGTPELDTTQVQSFDVSQHPDTVTNLLVAKNKLWNDCMTLLGIKNSNQDKKERLVANEVDSNSEQVDMVKNISLTERQHAADAINRMYELNVSVGFNHTSQESDVGIPDASGNDSGNDEDDESGGE